MVRKIIVFSVLMISLLGACSQQDAEPSKEPVITLNDVETAITEQGLELEDTDLPSESAFNIELNGVQPKAYVLDGQILSIYVFSSEGAREKGMEDFVEKTATMELVNHETYTNKNILVFYVEGSEETKSKLNTAINELE